MQTIVDKQRSKLQKRDRPFGLADQLLYDIEKYEFDLDSVSSYEPVILDEIKHGITDLRSIRNVETKPFLRQPIALMKDKAVNATDPLVRDQAVWGLIEADDPEVPKVLIASLQGAPTRELAISAMLALEKVAHKMPDAVSGALNELASDPSDIELAEWARLKLNEMMSSVPGEERRLEEAVSSRDFVYEPGRVFDTTMPLVFHCDAYTQAGPVTLHTVVSPHWFETLFGSAMACVRSSSFTSNLVLEKDVPNLHADGSAHYEH